MAKWRSMFGDGQLLVGPCWWVQVVIKFDGEDGTIDIEWWTVMICWLLIDAKNQLLMVNSQ